MFLDRHGGDVLASIQAILRCQAYQQQVYQACKNLFIYSDDLPADPYSANPPTPRNGNTPPGAQTNTVETERNEMVSSTCVEGPPKSNSDSPGTLQMSNSEYFEAHCENSSLQHGSPKPYRPKTFQCEASSASPMAHSPVYDSLVNTFEPSCQELISNMTTTSSDAPNAIFENACSYTTRAQSVPEITQQLSTVHMSKPKLKVNQGQLLPETFQNQESYGTSLHSSPNANVLVLSPGRYSPVCNEQEHMFGRLSPIQCHVEQDLTTRKVKRKRSNSISSRMSEVCWS